MTEKKPDREELWVYVGLRETTKDTLIQAFLPLTPEKKLKEETKLIKLVQKHARPGQMYSVTCSGATAVYTGGRKGPKYWGMWDDEDQVAEWSSLHIAAEGLQRARKAQKESPSADESLRKALRPILQAMKKTDRTGRDVIVATVVRILLTGGLL